MLFPLPFTAFEYYYWCDDTPQFPKTFPFELWFSGVLDQTAFRAALRQAQERHPLLTALVNDQTRIPCWIDGRGLEPLVDWADESVPITHPDGECIDLRREVGVRVFVRTGPARTRLVLHFHHACQDGLGTIKFTEDLFLAYHAALSTDSGTPPLRSLDLEQLRQRGYFAATKYENPSLRIAARDLWITLYEWSALLLRNAAPLAEPNGKLSPAGGANPSLPVSSHDTSAKAGLFDYSVASIDGQVVAQLRQAAAQASVTLNDLLLRDMFLVLRAWNQRHGGRIGRWLRLNVPVNLREGEEITMPAANRIGFAFVSADARAGDNPAALLAVVRDETARIKLWKLGLYFLGGLQLASGIPGVVPWTLGRRRCLATMVLSNLGRLFAHTPLPRQEGRLVVGNVVLERMAGFPPLRPLTRAALAVFEYAGSMTLALKCDPQLFTRDDAHDLLAAYVRQLNQTAQHGA